MPEIKNGERRQLVIDGVHNGICGVVEPTAADKPYQAIWSIAFRPSIGRIEPRDGLAAALDGEPFRLVRVREYGAGFYTAVLAEIGPEQEARPRSDLMNVRLGRRTPR